MNIKQSKKKFLEERTWKKIRVHLTKQSLIDLKYIDRRLKRHSQSATVRECISLAKIFLLIRDVKINNTQNDINNYKIKEWELFVK